MDGQADLGQHTGRADQRGWWQARLAAGEQRLAGQCSPPCLRRGGAYLSPRCRLRSTDKSSSCGPLPPPNQPPPPFDCSSTSQSSRIWGGPMRVPSRVGTRGSACVVRLLGSPSGATSKKPVILPGEGGGVGCGGMGWGGWLSASESCHSRAAALEGPACRAGIPGPGAAPLAVRATAADSLAAAQPLHAFLQLCHRHAADFLHRDGAQVADVADGHAVDLRSKEAAQTAECSTCRRAQCCCMQQGGLVLAVSMAAGAGGARRDTQGSWWGQPASSGLHNAIPSRSTLLVRAPGPPTLPSLSTKMLTMSPRVSTCKQREREVDAP